MNVLLLSTPDSFEHVPPMAVRMPNGALASLAGNVDAHHRVSIADLILAQPLVKETVDRHVGEYRTAEERRVSIAQSRLGVPGHAPDADQTRCRIRFVGED